MTITSGSLKIAWTFALCISMLLPVGTACADSTEISGKTMNDSTVIMRTMPPSSEKSTALLTSFSTSAPSGITEPRGTEAPQKKGDGDLCGPVDGLGVKEPFMITVDGQPVVGKAGKREVDRQRCVDVALAKSDIQVHYDPLQVSPALNAWTVPNGVERGKEIRFFTYTNYALWLRKAEIRIFLKDQDSRQEPYAVIPVPVNGKTVWHSPAGAPDELFFLLRVYDGRDRFDETAAKKLTLLTKSTPPGDTEREAREELMGFGENSRKMMNIPVRGGTVTINGKHIKNGETVSALGFPVPVDKEGTFTFRQIMSPGPHTVEIVVKDKEGGEKVFRRNISIADKDWFYIAVGDLTMGRNSVTGPAELVTGDKDHYSDHEYIDGRGAFYLKGLIKGEYLLTASADTRERPLRDLFTNFDSKDPQYLLRRIDPDKFYPVYGDDSTITDDAPTQGKFYVRLERGDSYVMWGNFQTSWTNTELTQYSRGLYGADLVLSSEGTTKYGEKKHALNAFAADPGTLSSREEFRGTGGSLYYLRHLDITQGSDRVWVEIRDRDSGIVIERRQLTPAEDYDINYIQGRIMLRAPLPSTADGSTLVRTSSADGNPVYLVATYEYVPGFDQLTSLAFGGQAGFWLNDNFRFGGTFYRQGEDQDKQELQGFDVTARYKPGTLLKAEIARSDGPGNGTLTSATGGYGFNQTTSDGERATAWRVDGALDFSELWDGGKGRTSAYWREKERGFSAPGQITDTGEAVSQVGFAAQIPVGTLQIDAKADHLDSDSLKKRAAEMAAKKKLNDEFAVSVGTRYDDREVAVPNASETLSRNGSRTDAIARIDYTPVAQEGRKDKEGKPASILPLYKSWGLYGFLQGTIARTEDRNEYDRAGVGGAWQATDRFKVGAEASGGYGGLGGKVSGDYRIDDRRIVYASYAMETEIPDEETRGSKGTGVFGSKYKVSDRVGLFGETRFTNGYSSSLTHSFGLDLAPNDRWTYGLKFETGTVSDEFAGDMRRTAVGLATTYKFEKTKFANAVEYRKDAGGTEDRSTWLVRNSLGYQIDPSWRLLGKLNFSVSNSTAGTYYDADFVEAVFGAAFRPVTNDRWNALFKYTYFYNLPSPGQVAASSTAADYLQKSHIVNMDVIYDLLPWLSVGGKYGLRYGELKASRIEGKWFSSTAQLFVARADFHIVRKWDALIEGRQLSATEARDTRSGILVAIYRHLNKNVKMGVGYNFTDFSDNLTDLSYRSRGVFLNILGTL
jgi:hypothetical protein